MNLFDIQVLHKSGFYQVRNFTCNYLGCYLSDPEANQSFSFCIMRAGYFEYHDHRRETEMHVGRLLILKPDHEHRIKLIKTQPDVSTIIDFTPAFYELVKVNYQKEAGWFFTEADLNSMLIACGAELDHLHHLLYQQSLKHSSDSLLMDDLVIRMVDKVMRVMGNKPNIDPLKPALKKYHLSTVEQAKTFIIDHFNENINLQMIADHCCISLFHFCRIFKSIMRSSPYQYLNEIRLQHARVLLSGDKLPVTEIAFQCGFNSLEQFDAAFRTRYKVSPTVYRRKEYS